MIITIFGANHHVCSDWPDPFAWGDPCLKPTPWRCFSQWNARSSHWHNGNENEPTFIRFSFFFDLEFSHFRVRRNAVSCYYFSWNTVTDVCLCTGALLICDIVFSLSRALHRWQQSPRCSKALHWWVAVMDLPLKSQFTNSAVIQRIAVAISCAIFFCMISMEDGLPKSSLLAVVTLLACAEKLSSIMNAISVGRDWVRKSFTNCTFLNRRYFRSS